MAEENFKVGDKVQLKSGSTTMTINSITTDYGTCTCVYFAPPEWQFKQFSFALVALTKV